MARTKKAAALSSVKMLLSDILPTFVPELEKALDEAYKPGVAFKFSLEHRLRTDPVPTMLKQALTYWIKCWLKDERDLEPYAVSVCLSVDENDNEVYHLAEIDVSIKAMDLDPDDLTLYNEINETLRVAKRKRDEADQEAAPAVDGESEPKKARVEPQ
jgi:hypothetical protein